MVLAQKSAKNALFGFYSCGLGNIGAKFGSYGIIIKKCFLINRSQNFYFEPIKIF